MGSKEHVNCGSSVKRTEDKVSLVLDMIQHGGNCVSQCEVECPVARGGKGNRFSTNICGKDFRGIGPRDGALTLAQEHMEDVPRLWQKMRQRGRNKR